MKKFLVIALAGALMLFCGFKNLETKPAAQLTYITGEVLVVQEGTLKPVEAQIDMPLFPGDCVKTGKESRCEITYSNGSVVRLDQNTEFELFFPKTEKDKKAKDNSLRLGRIWSNIVKLLQGRESFDIRTPTAVAGVRGTVYQIECDDTHSNFKVFKGAIGVTPLDKEGMPAEKAFELETGEMFILVNNFEEYKKQHRKAFKRFREEQEKEFEQYKRKEKQAYEDLREKELKAFRKFMQYHILLHEFDMEKEKKDEWVRWNLKRDKM